MSQKKTFDLWLERFSYLSQTGLFFLTVFTLYYTVIPVFQNASLQESIAQKESELKGMKKEAELLYLSLKNEYINKFRQALTFDCNPGTKAVMLPSLPPGEGRDEKEYLDTLSYIDFDVMQCVMLSLKSNSYVKKLKVEDVEELSKKINGIKKRIEDTQIKYKNIVRNKKEMAVKGKAGSKFVPEIEDVAIKNGVDVKWVNQLYITAGARMALYDYGEELNVIYNSIDE